LLKSLRFHLSKHKFQRTRFHLFFMYRILYALSIQYFNGMKPLKAGLLILSFGCIALVLLSRYPLTTPTENKITASIIANTLTQSLDGHRRYLTLEHSELGTFRLGIPATTDCQVDDSALLQELSNQLTQARSYQFISCSASLENGKL